MSVQEIVSDEEVEKVHGSAQFGIPKRAVLDLGVLKCASGYYQGFTSKVICIEHGLITPKTYKLTRKGQKYLWEAWRNGRDF